MLATTTAKAQAENIDKVELQIGEYGNAQNWGPLSSSILGMTIDPHFDGTNNVESKIYVEACIHPGYYENYPTASKGLTEEES